MVDTEPSIATPEPIALAAADGFIVKGFVWRRRAPDARSAPERPVVIVNAATSVRCRYYFRFAAFLFAHGCDAIVYDYRGIGESRPPTLAGFRASWLDWGRLDFQAVLRYAQDAFRGQPIDVVAHSIGGFVVGLAPSNHLIRRVFTMGAQYAHWRDYAPRHKLAMLWKWHVLMPALAGLLGYVPARRLGWMEDTPKGVALSWSRSKPRFEDTYRRRPIARAESERRALAQQFRVLRAPLLAVSVTDDEFGTVPAIERLLGYFTGATVTHLRISPAAIGVPAIGHFAFFHSRFEASLWRIPLAWLKTGTLGEDVPGSIVMRRGGPSCHMEDGSPVPSATCSCEE